MVKTGEKKRSSGGSGGSPRTRFKQAGTRLQRLTTAGSSQLASAIAPRSVGPFGAPYDFFTYQPSSTTPYGTWFGCILSTWAATVFTLFTMYAIYQFVTTPFDISQGTVPMDPDVAYSRATDPAMPETGVQFLIDNGTAFYDENYISLTFTQRIFRKSGPDAGREEFAIPAVPCDFSVGEDDPPQFSDARCPAHGYIDSQGSFVAAESTGPANAKLPVVPLVQGTFNDDVYAFLQVELVVMLDRAEAEPDMLAELYGGRLVPIARSSSFNVHDITAFSKATRVWDLDSFRFEVLRDKSIKTEVYLQARHIERESEIIDFGVLEDHTYDLTLQEFQTVLEDVPARRVRETQEQQLERGRIATLYFRLAGKSHFVRVSPFVSVFDFLGMLGGLLALLQFTIGLPTTWINKALFYFHSRRAAKAGQLDSRLLKRQSSQTSFATIVTRLKEYERTKTRAGSGLEPPEEHHMTGFESEGDLRDASHRIGASRTDAIEEAGGIIDPQVVISPMEGLGEPLPAGDNGCDTPGSVAPWRAGGGGGMSPRARSPNTAPGSGNSVWDSMVVRADVNEIQRRWRARAGRDRLPPLEGAAGSPPSSSAADSPGGSPRLPALPSSASVRGHPSGSTVDSAVQHNA